VLTFAAQEMSELVCGGTANRHRDQSILDGLRPLTNPTTPEVDGPEKLLDPFK
jgi:hypothetical protein